MEQTTSGRTGRRTIKSRIALHLQYDGTNFNGWQLQDSGRTVQGELEKALRIISGENIRVTASGRTDAGVHALCQVVHFDMQKEFELKRLAIGLNGILPKDVSVVNVYSVPDSFNARFGPVERKYKYVIYNHPLRSPFMMYRSMWVKDPIDENYLRETTSYLIGEHDFASFCKKVSSEKINTVRKINKIIVKKNNDFLIINISGTAFLHNMVRTIVGTILDMSKNGDDPSVIMDILAEKDRCSSGVTAPPYALYLKKIIYAPSLSTMPSAF